MPSVTVVLNPSYSNHVALVMQEVRLVVPRFSGLQMTTVGLGMAVSLEAGEMEETRVSLPQPSLCFQAGSQARPGAHCGASGRWAVGIGSSSLDLLFLPPPQPVSSSGCPSRPSDGGLRQLLLLGRGTSRARLPQRCVTAQPGSYVCKESLTFVQNSQLASQFHIHWYDLILKTTIESRQHRALKPLFPR